MYGLKKVAVCLRDDRDVLLAFYDFPAEHWQHLRTTNPIESTFATVRLRTKRTKGCGSRVATLTMVYKLIASASKKWRRLNGYDKLPDVAILASISLTARGLQLSLSLQVTPTSGISPLAR